MAKRNMADAERAAGIIHRIRAMTGQRALTQTSITLESVIEDVMFLFGPEFKRKGVVPTLDLMAPAPQVMADRIQLQQVFANMVMNALQAMTSEGQRRLVIRTSLLNPEHVNAEVEDSGPGIPIQHLPRLFESFFTTKEEGVGIGLALCRSIIESHGGRIEAMNLPDGRGARFHFYYP